LKALNLGFNYITNACLIHLKGKFYPFIIFILVHHRIYYLRNNYVAYFVEKHFDVVFRRT